MPVITEETPIKFCDPLPEKTDVMIIGGGIAGIMTAWYLNKAGKNVLVCEKGRVAGEQSCRNWGYVRQAGRDIAELPMMIDCIPDWQELQKEIGDAVGFRQIGSLFTNDNEEVLAGYEQWAKLGRDHGLETGLVGPKQISQILGMDHKPYLGGLYTKSDGCAEPFTAVPAIAECLHAKGNISIRENCAVRTLDIEGGKITGVHTEDGYIRADQVLVAGGIWSGRLLKNHGLHFPQLLGNTTISRTEPVEDQRAITFGHPDACFRARADGGYNLMPGEIMEHEICYETFAHALQFLPALKRYRDHTSVIAGLYEGFGRRLFSKRRWTKDDVTPFEKTRALNPRLSKKHVRKILPAMAKHFPELAQLKIVESWTGATDLTPDVLPALGKIKRYEGLYIASGLSGHGFGLGPAVGKVLADVITGRPDKYDISALRFERFSDGTKLHAAHVG